MRLTREKTVRISHRIIDLLVATPEVDFVEDRDTIRQEIVTILSSLLKLEEQVDTEVRAKITSQKKEILEGSEEWDILYRKYYAEGLKRLGVAEVHHRRELRHHARGRLERFFAGALRLLRQWHHSRLERARFFVDTLRAGQRSAVSAVLAELYRGGVVPQKIAAGFAE